jgi:hypothetical protein
LEGKKERNRKRKEKEKEGGEWSRKQNGEFELKSKIDYFLCIYI